VADATTGLRARGHAGLTGALITAGAYFLLDVPFRTAILIGPALALVPLLAVPKFTVGADIALALAQAVGILLLAIVGGRYLLQPILHRVTRARNREVFTALAVLLVLGSALLTEAVGLSMAMGAFIAGLLIADSPFRHGVIA